MGRRLCGKIEAMNEDKAKPAKKNRGEKWNNTLWRMAGTKGAGHDPVNQES